MEALNGAQDGDIVIVKRELNKRGRPSAIVVAILGKAERFGVAILEIHTNAVLNDIKTMQPIGATLDEEALSRHQQGDLFSVDITSQSVQAYLGHISNAHVDEKISLALFNKHDEFDEEVLAQAKRFHAVQDEEILQRRDLRSLNFCTIDPVTAKDFDDAIFWDEAKHCLYVAIADVSHYVSPFGAIDQEAIYRAFSIYFPHRSVPMLPRLLSETLCSLQPHVDRLAFVCEMQLDSTQTRVVSSQFYEAVIHSKRRFTYEEVDTIFNNNFQVDSTNENEQQIVTMLHHLKNVTDKLKRDRMKEGFEFCSPDLMIVLDESAMLTETFFAQETPSHALIEDCMLLANKEAAKRFDRGIYRIHEPPSNAKLQALFNELSSIGISIEPKNSPKESIYAIQALAKSYDLEQEVDTLLIRAQMQARYLPYNKGHFGLGFKAYTHFTSPIRRYSDLLVHRIIKAKLHDDTDEYHYVLRNIETLSSAISEKEREASSVEIDFKKRKFARWAHAHMNEQFTARVVATEPDYLAQIEGHVTGVVVTLHVHEHVELFDTVELSITKADITTTKIEALLLKVVKKVQKVVHHEAL